MSVKIKVHYYYYPKAIFDSQIRPPNGENTIPNGIKYNSAFDKTNSFKRKNTFHGEKSRERNEPIIAYLFKSYVSSLTGGESCPEGEKKTWLTREPFPPKDRIPPLKT